MIDTHQVVRTVVPEDLECPAPGTILFRAKMNTQFIMVDIKLGFIAEGIVLVGRVQSTQQVRELIER